MKSANIIIGIDPGSRSTGYGLIEIHHHQLTHIAHGHIPCQQNSLSERLYHIYQSLTKVIQTYQPKAAAIEHVFTCHNSQSALKLGQARGAALVALAEFALPVAEYSATQIKKAVVGYGAAAKGQIQYMVRLLLNLPNNPQVDAADALAIALCHANSQKVMHRLEASEAPSSS